MKKSKIFVFLAIFLIYLLIVSLDNKPSKQDINDAVLKTIEYYKNSKGLDSVCTFDGRNLDFTITLQEQLSEAEAAKLFQEVLDNIELYSNNEDTWKYYNANIVFLYNDLLFFRGTKSAGEKAVIAHVEKISLN